MEKKTAFNRLKTLCSTKRCISFPIGHFHKNKEIDDGVVKKKEIDHGDMKFRNLSRSCASLLPPLPSRVRGSASHVRVDGLLHGTIFRTISLSSIRATQISTHGIHRSAK
jgi:hypothetical protein